MRSLRKNFFFALLILLSFIPLLDLLHPGLPVTHDGQDHVARIANFYQNLQEGNAIPRWAPNLNWGYGHPILMFLYPLPSYTSSLIHFLGFSFVDSVKIFFGLAFVVSGLAMYLWLKEWLSREGAFVGAMLYMFAPYRFVDLYVRGAIGEHAAFIFPPLVLYFLFKLSQKQSSWHIVGGSLSLAGLILAHNAISLMFLPIIGLYAALLILQAKKKKLLIAHCSLLILFGFMLSAFFWLPALIEGKYTLRDIVTKGEVFKRFVPLYQLLYLSWRYGDPGQLSFQTGLIHWLFIVVSAPFIFVLKKKKDKNWIVLLVLCMLFLFTLFLMTPYSELIWQKITTLQKFQFPWRFLSLAVFLSSVIGAAVFSQITKTKGLKTSQEPSHYVLGQKTILVIFVGLLLLVSKDYWHPKAYLQKPESFYTTYLGTTDTGESAPIWSVRFMEARPKLHMEVIGGKAKVKEVNRNSTSHSYKVDASTEVQLRENTLYFPGWKVLVDGVEVPIAFQDAHNRGVITFIVEKGKHDVTITFGETKLRLLADWISLVSLLVLLGLSIMRAKVIDVGYRA